AAARRLAGSRRSARTVAAAPAAVARSALDGSCTIALTCTPRRARAGTTSAANFPVAPTASTFIVLLLRCVRGDCVAAAQYLAAQVFCERYSVDLHKNAAPGASSAQYRRRPA